MENKIKTQRELGAVHLEKKGLDKERFKDLIKGHEVFCLGIDFSLDDPHEFIENWLCEGFTWVSTSEPDPESKLITLDELEEMLNKRKFNVFCATNIEEDDLYENGGYRHWSKGLTMYITKNGVTIQLNQDEIQEVVKSLPRTIGGSY